MESLTRVIAPALGGVLLPVGRARGDRQSFSAALMVYVAGFVWRRLFVNPDPPLEPRSVAAGVHPMSSAMTPAQTRIDENGRGAELPFQVL